MNTSSLYRLARILNTAKAISKGRAGQRAWNILVGRTLGRVGRRLWK